MSNVPSPHSAGAAHEAEESLLCSPEVEARFRRSRDRPAQVGLYLLLGLSAVCGGSAVALISAHRATAAIGLVIFMSLLVGLALVLRTLIRRDRDHRPLQAHLWTDGVELVLANGDVRAKSWDDPTLEIEVYILPRTRRGESQRLLAWKSDREIPTCNLSAEGFARLTRAAKEHGLRIDTFRWGRRRREVLAYEIRRDSSKPDASVDGLGATV